MKKNICTKIPRSLYLLFNHSITKQQKKDARENLGVDLFIDLPPDLKALWSQIPPNLAKISDYLAPLKEWLAGNAGDEDYVLIQGDFGACFIMVSFACEKGLIPVYSTTRREAEEEYDEKGIIKMTHRFQHQIFRRYGA